MVKKISEYFNEYYSIEYDSVKKVGFAMDNNGNIKYFKIVDNKICFVEKVKLSKNHLIIK